MMPSHDDNLCSIEAGRRDKAGSDTATGGYHTICRPCLILQKMAWTRSTQDTSMAWPSVVCVCDTVDRAKQTNMSATHRPASQAHGLHSPQSVLHKHRSSYPLPAHPCPGDQ
ncbi:hypothetical protein ACOMHN_025126 [Nucella lapillus]